MAMIKQYLLLVVALVCTPCVYSLTFTLDPNSDIVGEVQYYTVQKGDTMHSIARKFDMGLKEMQEANPKANASNPAVGTQLLVPSMFILPNAPREGIVLNVAELRLYYYPADQNVVITHPVGIGREGWRTPVGETTIIRKRANPTWTPPPSIRRYSAAKGINLPAVVPAGPNNPLGQYAMNLGWNNYLMHGTNAPTSIGVRSSSGCIRMYPEDIEQMFKLVSIGTKVKIVHEPFKIGVKNGQVYLEAHTPFIEQYYNEDGLPEDMILEQAIYADVPAQHADSNVDWGLARKLINDTYGYPVPIHNQYEDQPASPNM